MCKRVLAILLFISFSFLTGKAQKINEDYVCHINKMNESVRIDGELNESFWLKTDVAKNFYMMLPMDTSFANVRTEVRMAYDDQNIYLSAVCFDDLPGGYVVQSLRRDFSFGANDNFLV
ncbi:hydrolase, partial [Bacteroidota bacterium]